MSVREDLNDLSAMVESFKGLISFCCLLTKVMTLSLCEKRLL